MLVNSTKIKGNDNSHSTQILPEDRSENTLKLILETINTIILIQAKNTQMKL